VGTASKAVAVSEATLGIDSLLTVCSYADSLAHAGQMGPPDKPSFSEACITFMSP